MARMKYEIILAPEAVQDLKLLDAYQKAKIKDLIEVHLRHEPTKTSKSRIKRLRGLRHPQYRLKIDDFRHNYKLVGLFWRIASTILCLRSGLNP